MQTIEIKKLGPIEYLKTDIQRFNVFTGPQSNGKSTVAKSIYFFKTVKSDAYQLITQQKENSEYQTSPVTRFKKILKLKFLNLFGSTWKMPVDMKLTYHYSVKTYIQVFRRDGEWYGENSYLKFSISEDIQKYLRSHNGANYGENAENIQKDLCEIFADTKETVMIPAGRSMITLLSDQIAYIFSSMDEFQARAVDLCTRNYVNLILKLKPGITPGLEYLYRQKKTDLNSNKNERLQYGLELIENILHGRYVNKNGEDRLELKNEMYEKINFASSGQQEMVWVCNILFYYMLLEKPVFLIIEEPESHLYPDSQMQTADLLGLFLNCNNSLLITTHSPYMLGEFNNMLYANEVPSGKKREAIIRDDVILPYSEASALFIHNGGAENGIQDHLIRNELIDGASGEINDRFDSLMELKLTGGADG